MWGYLTTGVAYAFAAAVQPGPLQAYLVSLTLIHGWRRALPAVFAPLLSDIPAACLALVVLTRIPPAGVNALRLVGGFFLLYLAAGALGAWRDYRPAEALPPRSARHTLVTAVTVNLLNPNPYLGWSLVVGPALLQAWRLAPWIGVALIVSFYATMIAATAALMAIFAAAHALGPRVGRGLVGVSALALGGFGIYQLSSGALALAAML